MNIKSNNPIFGDNFSNLGFNENENKSYISENKEKYKIKKKISKISILMEKLKNKKNDNDESTESSDELENSNLSSKSLENIINNNIFKKYDVYFYFFFQKKEYISQIETDFFNLNQNKVQDLIKNIVHKINEKNIIIKTNKNKYIMSLKDCEEELDKDFFIHNYELKPCKQKSFSNKQIFSIYHPDSFLSEIHETRLSFISTNPLNIMLREI